MLVPEVAAGAAHELRELRRACGHVVAALAASRPDVLVVVGPTEPGAGGRYPGGATGSFRGFGVDVEVRLGAAAHTATGGRLPLSLTVAAWLLREAAFVAAPVEGLGVEETLDPRACADAGRELAGAAERVALLVMGDGSACRTLKAPGYLDDRAIGFDSEVAAALGSADLAAITALDRGLASELGAVGRAPWQVLAGAAEGAGLRATMRYDAAPYGVGYFVAQWCPEAS